MSGNIDLIRLLLAGTGDNKINNNMGNYLNDLVNIDSTNETQTNNYQINTAEYLAAREKNKNISDSTWDSITNFAVTTQNESFLQATKQSLEGDKNVITNILTGLGGNKLDTGILSALGDNILNVLASKGGNINKADIDTLIDVDFKNYLGTLSDGTAAKFNDEQSASAKTVLSNLVDYCAERDGDNTKVTLTDFDSVIREVKKTEASDEVVDNAENTENDVSKTSIYHDPIEFAIDNLTSNNLKTRKAKISDMAFSYKRVFADKDAPNIPSDFYEKLSTKLPADGSTIKISSFINTSYPTATKAEKDAMKKALEGMSENEGEIRNFDISKSLISTEILNMSGIELTKENIEKAQDSIDGKWSFDEVAEAFNQNFGIEKADTNKLLEALGNDWFSVQDNLAVDFLNKRTSADAVSDLTSTDTATRKEEFNKVADAYKEAYAPDVDAELPSDLFETLAASLPDEGSESITINSFINNNYKNVSATQKTAIRKILEGMAEDSGSIRNWDITKSLVSVELMQTNGVELTKDNLEKAKDSINGKASFTEIRNDFHKNLGIARSNTTKMLSSLGKNWDDVQDNFANKFLAKTEITTQTIPETTTPVIDSTPTTSSAGSTSSTASTISTDSTGSTGVTSEVTNLITQAGDHLADSLKIIGGITEDFDDPDLFNKFIAKLNSSSGYGIIESSDSDIKAKFPNISNNDLTKLKQLIRRLGGMSNQNETARLNGDDTGILVLSTAILTSAGQDITFENIRTVSEEFAKAGSVGRNVSTVSSNIENAIKTKFPNVDISADKISEIITTATGNPSKIEALGNNSLESVAKNALNRLNVSTETSASTGSTSSASSTGSTSSTNSTASTSSTDSTQTTQTTRTTSEAVSDLTSTNVKTRKAEFNSVANAYKEAYASDSAAVLPSDLFEKLSKALPDEGSESITINSFINNNYKNVSATQKTAIRKILEGMAEDSGSIRKWDVTKSLISAEVLKTNGKELNKENLDKAKDSINSKTSFNDIKTAFNKNLGIPSANTNKILTGLGKNWYDVQNNFATSFLDKRTSAEAVSDLTSTDEKTRKTEFNSVANAYKDAYAANVDAELPGDLFETLSKALPDEGSESITINSFINNNYKNVSATQKTAIRKTLEGMAEDSGLIRKWDVTKSLISAEVLKTNGVELTKENLDKAKDSINSKFSFNEIKSDFYKNLGIPSANTNTMLNALGKNWDDVQNNFADKYLKKTT